MNAGKIKLTFYEKEIEEAIEKGEFEPVNNLKEWEKALENAVENKLREIELKLRFSSVEKKAINILRQYMDDDFEILSSSYK